MLVFGALLVNIFVTLGFYLKNPKEYKWFEVVLSLTITLGLIIGAKALVDHTSVMFNEYWGETIVRIYEQEPYNYWHSETCSRQVACGTDSDGNTQYCTEYYDCSHQDDVGPSWWCKTDLGNTYNMGENYYDELVVLFGTETHKTEQHKNYDAKDKCVNSKGTKFQGQRVGEYSYVNVTNWDSKETSRRGVFTKHRYENRIKASDLSLFNLSPISKAEADSLGLFQYPEKIDKYNCPVFLGGNVSKETQTMFNRLNAKYGPSNEFRLWILVYENKPLSIAIKQENYWVKGNKNELVICIGINDKKEIQWSHSFSWEKSNNLTPAVKSRVLDMYEYSIETTKGQKLPIAIPLNTKLKKSISDVTGIDTTYLPPVLPIKELGLTEEDIVRVVKSPTPVFNERTLAEYYEYLDINLKKFKRRSFSEFYYLKVKPKPLHTKLIYLMAFIVSIGLNLYFSLNDINEDNNWKKRKKYQYRRRRF